MSTKGFRAFRGVSNAASSSFRLNDRIKNQSLMAAAHGQGQSGIHWDLGFELDELGKSTLDAVVADLFATLQRFSNYRSPYTMENLKAYITIANFMDAAIAEWNRDLRMYKWRDTYSENAFADFWGPYYQRVVDDYANLPGYNMTYNNVVSQAATAFPHVSVPVYQTLSYLLGNVFKDDSEGRAGYIYFHMFNNSLSSNQPSISHAQTWVAKMVDVLNGTVAYPKLQMSDGSLSTPYIVADIMKVWGSSGFMQYPLATGQEMVTPVYDNDLVVALANKKGWPYMWWYNAGELQNVLPSPNWRDDNVNDFVMDVDNQGYAYKRLCMTYEEPESFYRTTLLGYSQGDFLYKGEMEGDAIMANTYFRPNFDSVADSRSDEIGWFCTIATSPYGIYCARAWVNLRDVNFNSSSETNKYNSIFVMDTYVTQDSVANDGMPLQSSEFMHDNPVVPAGLALANKVFNSMDAGRVDMVTVQFTDAGAVAITAPMAEDIDEYAIISNSGLDSMRSATIRSFYDTGVARFNQVSNTPVIATQSTDVGTPQATIEEGGSPSRSRKRSGHGGYTRGGGAGRR